jgi:hypothetical protein
VWMDDRFFAFYERYTSFWVHVCYMWLIGPPSEMANRPSVGEEEGQGRVVWASERFMAKRQSTI